MHTRDGAVPRIALRVDEFSQACRAAGLDNSTARAKRLGIRHTTVSRAERGRTDPGVRFIAAALTAFPDRKFEDLFEVIGSDGQRTHARDNERGDGSTSGWLCPECGHLNAPELVVCAKTAEHD
ncbi:hypothetical protein [Spirillospora sp. CA-128828]|uniref:hypothetical protein n=1 Tax=Spirillospora sp. CA-128828 TaxID=3240033 RepID=UPI003D8CAE8F